MHILLSFVSSCNATCIDFAERIWRCFSDHRKHLLEVVHPYTATGSQSQALFYIVQSLQKLDYSRFVPLLPITIVKYQKSGVRYIFKALG